MEQLNTQNIFYFMFALKRTVLLQNIQLGRLVSEPGTTSLESHLLPSGSQSLANHLPPLFDNCKPPCLCLHAHLCLGNKYLFCSICVTDPYKLFENKVFYMHTDILLMEFS